MTAFLLLAAIVVYLGLLYIGRGYQAWLGGGLLLWLALSSAGLSGWLLLPLALLLIGAGVLFGVDEWRQRWVSAPLMRSMAKVLPKLGDTERIALEAGTVWWDGELFSGRPDWQQLLDFRVPPPADEVQAFLDGPVAELCTMLDDWQIQQDRDLPPKVWSFLRKQRFFGMIIPTEYGGLGFGADAHSRVVTRIASRSVTAAVTVMVPNSLGPAELLLHYGTEAQRRHYLPRLASGEDLPCFALTGPEAGSDAAATQSVGIVEAREVDGEPVLGMRLSWKKRYITLAPVATLIGLAFRLKDPDGLLGEAGRDYGITCALIPRDTPGVQIGQRHDPMGVPFMNGPTVGEDVWVPLEQIIGGPEGAGAGWKMLMESLAAGRSVSLPALSVGATQFATRLVGAYATVREQFDTPIGRFEGVEEPLARIAGLTYVLGAARRLTCAALDAGHRPSVVSAIVKAYMTDAMRQVITDAMDVRAGAAIIRGPRNMLSRIWASVPIGITVEGANILTRSMIIYGQGAIRCHPFVEREIAAIADGDLAAFDAALFGHLNFVTGNGARAFVLALCGSRLAAVPDIDRNAERFMQHLSRFSAAFAVTSDVAMGTLGGSLKRREKISGRLADCLAWMYLASAAIKRFHDEDKSTAHYDLLKWVAAHALYQVQQALRGVIDNLPMRMAAWKLDWIIFPLGARFKPPSDRLGAAVARSILEDRAARGSLTSDIYMPPAEEPGLGALEAALDKAVRALPVEARIKQAVREGRIDRAPGRQLDEIALAAGVITQAEFELLAEADAARDEVIAVDAFEPKDYRKLR